MTTAQIDKELKLLSLKNKLLFALKYYLSNTLKTDLDRFYSILNLLTKKYTDPIDVNFVEHGIRYNVRDNDISVAISNISTCINNYMNEHLLNDLLNTIAV